MFEILERLEKTYKGKDLDLVNRAYDFAKKAHANQKRASGEDYFIHPCFVAKILVDLGLDAATIAAALAVFAAADNPSLYIGSIAEAASPMRIYPFPVALIC